MTWSRPILYLNVPKSRISRSYTPSRVQPTVSSARLGSEPAHSSSIWLSNHLPPATAGEALSQPRWMTIAEAALNTELSSPPLATDEPRSTQPANNGVAPPEFSASEWVPHHTESESRLIAREAWLPPKLTAHQEPVQAEHTELEPLANEAAEGPRAWLPEAWQHEIDDSPAEEREPTEPADEPEAWQPRLEQPPPTEPAHRDPQAWQHTPTVESESKPAANPSRWLVDTSRPLRTGDEREGLSETGSRWVPNVLDKDQGAGASAAEAEARPSTSSASPSEWLPEELAQEDLRSRPRRPR